MSVHPSAAGGFGRAAETYERSRPDYPLDAVAWLANRLRLGPGTTVVDLAAGTGKLTRLLVPTRATVIAVEPLEAMRAVLEATVLGVEVRAGYAELMPITDGHADAVTIAQAFNWFATEESVAEIARVLRPGGTLGLVWNVRDQDDGLQRAFTEIVESLRGDEPRHDQSAWRGVLEASESFGPIEERTFRHEQLLDGEGLAERASSISFVAVAPAKQRAKVVARVRALARDRIVRFRYLTSVHVSRRSQAADRHARRPTNTGSEVITSLSSRL